MKIQVNTDSSVKGDQRLESYVEDRLATKLERFRDDITRIEIHIRDENAEKGGADDKRCMMEARLRGRDPTAVTHNHSTVKDAINGATAKLKRVLAKTVDQRKQHR